MLKNRKIQMLGTAVLIAAAILVTIPAVRTPASALIPFTGSNSEGLAIYQRSEQSAQVANPKGLAIYYQSERGQAYSAQSEVTPATSYEAGLAQYHRSERGMPLAVTDGLAIYHQSERTQSVNWIKSSDPLYKYHQSEWFGK
jgi:hypothetical protein